MINLSTGLSHMSGAVGNEYRPWVTRLSEGNTEEHGTVYASMQLCPPHFPHGLVL